jgi:WhiB family redox-sensing transcriptional regulator
MGTRDVKWMDRAGCKNADPALFDTELGVSPDAAAAKDICYECPVRDECEAYGRDNRFPENIFGGLLPGERGIKIRVVSA